MKHLIYILLFFLCACTELIDKPKEVMDKILKRAQKIIIKRDPEAGQYIEEQIAEEKRKEKERQEKEKKEQEKALSGETKN